MLRDKLFPIFVVITFCLAAIIIVLAIKKSEKCDEHVLLDDNTEYDCKSVTSFENQMSTINLCDGERITVPTHRIKIITKIKE